MVDCTYPVNDLPNGEPQMARYKHYDYDQLMMVPVSLEEQLIPGTLEYAIHHVVEEPAVKDCAFWLFTRDDLIAIIGACMP